MKSSYKALVVDDSRVMRSMVMQTLQDSGMAHFEFLEAANGSEAMEAIDNEEIDIIFCDWNMPGMCGIEFARHIRATQWVSHIPVVMITSESGAGKRQDAFDQARITCYITKPFTVEDVIIKVTPVIQELKKKREKSAKTAPPEKSASAKQGGFFTKLLK